jgi:hypothetical protein
VVDVGEKERINNGREGERERGRKWVERECVSVRYGEEKEREGGWTRSF